MIFQGMSMSLFSLHRIEFGALWWQRNECDIVRHDKLGGQMPAGLIEQERRVPPRRDLFCDFGKM